MYLIFYCRGAIPLNCHSPTSHPSTFLQDFSSEFLDVWALFHNVFIITYTSQTHFVIPPPSSSGSGKREKERASAAVAVSSHPFPLVIFTPPSLQKRRLAHLFFFFFFLQYQQRLLISKNVQFCGESFGIYHNSNFIYSGIQKVFSSFKYH